MYVFILLVYCIQLQNNAKNGLTMVVMICKINLLKRTTNYSTYLLIKCRQNIIVNLYPVSTNN